MSLADLKKKIQEQIQLDTDNDDDPRQCEWFLSLLEAEEKEIRKNIEYLEKRLEPFKGQEYLVDELTQNDSELRIWKRVIGDES